MRSFVSGGGGYLGICGGAYFASRTVIWRGSPLDREFLGIFAGTAEGPDNGIAPYPGHVMCRLDGLDPSHPITQPEAGEVWMLYYWGPALSGGAAGVSTLARYRISGATAMAAFNYGAGRVFLVGTHPEIEEDGDRDGVVFADELDDHGSDWDLMRRAVAWLTQSG